MFGDLAGKIAYSQLFRHAVATKLNFDKRTIYALILTAVWIGIAVGLGYWKRDSLSTMGLNEIGDFLAGVLSPVAFLWLVIGYFQQGEELKLNTDALKLQADELKKSVAEQAALVETTRKQVELMEVAQREQRELETRRNQMCLRHVDGFTQLNDPLVQKMLRLRNDGHSVTQVTVTCTEPVTKLQPQYYLYINAGQTVELVLTFPKGVTEHGSITFNYVDGRNVDSEFSLFFLIRHNDMEIYYHPQEVIG